MTLTSDPKSGVLAPTRFGYGPHGDGDSLAAAADQRGFLKAELAQPGIDLLSGAGMPATPLALQSVFADQARKRAEKERLEKEAAEKATAANNKPASARNGRARPSSPSPNSAAPRKSTVRRAPITARQAPPFWPAVPLPADASSPTGRA
jgi:uncharacterized protein (DUF1800 family)